MTDREERDAIALKAAVTALQKIARGRLDNGRSLTKEASRQLAREMLVALGIEW